MSLHGKVLVAVVKRYPMRRCMLAAIGLLAVANCANEPAHHSVIQGQAYRPSEYRYAAAGKPLFTLIRGNPFASSRQDQLNALVLDAMSTGVRQFDVALVRRPQFTTNPDAPGRRANYNVTLVLSGAEEIQAKAICDPSEEVDVMPSEGNLRALMVFCRDGAVLSAAHGVVNAIDDPQDPRFHRLIAAMTRDLFPQRRFRDGGDVDIRPLNH